MTTTRRRIALLLTLSLGFVLVAAPSDPQSPGPSSSLPGQSATLLPDGRWLLMGGQGPAGPTDAAAFWDPGTGASTPLPVTLLDARAGHTATVLPDGTVLIVGGLGADGRPVARVERFDPTTAGFDPVPAAGLTPRAAHTATLLTDGRVLVAGGLDETGQPVADAELWDPRTGTAPPLPARLSAPRSGHTATLQADGTVLLWGGTDASGTVRADGEAYDPAAQAFSLVRTVPGPATPPAELVGTLPPHGAVGVPVDALLALRFSRPLRVDTVSAATVFLSGPDGLEPIGVVPAEGGRLAFLTPGAALRPGATYEVTVNGPTDDAGDAVPFTSVRFTTAAASSGPPTPGAAAGAGGTPGGASGEASADEDWVPNLADPVHGWRMGGPDSPWRSLPPLQAPPGVTALAGQVLRLNGEPLPDVTMRIGAASARTDPTGRFLLAPIPSGHHVLLIDGPTASRPGRTYGVFEVGVDVVAGQTTVLPHTIWMPRIDTEHAVTIPSPTTTEVVITTPRIPGLELHIPAGTVITDHEHHRVTEVSLTPIPLDRPPFPLAAGVEPPVYFTIQPGGGYVYNASRTGARLIYPNRLGWPGGARTAFWHYLPAGPGWAVYGAGAVTADARQVRPHPGVALYAFRGAMVGDPSLAPDTGPVPGTPEGGDPVNLATGLFVARKTDLLLPDVLPIQLTRTYRPGDGRVRPFGRGASHPYEWFLVGDTVAYSWIDVVRADGARLHYVRLNPGTPVSEAILEHATTPTRFYKSRIRFRGAATGWELTLTDGTVYRFRDGFGAARPGLAGLVELRDRLGNALRVERDSRGLVTRIVTPHGRWVAFTSDASDRITEARDVLGRVVTYAYDADSRLVRVTDPAGGVTEYTYDTAHRMLTLKDPRGIVFLTNEYDANGRVSRQTQADGTTFQFAYTVDGGGAVTQADVTDPRGVIRRVTFNPDRYPLTDIRALGQPEQQTTTYERQAGTNLVTAVIDPLSRRTESTYDAMGNVLTVTRLAGTPNAVTTTYTYEATYNQVTSVTDPLNHTTSFAYDALGRLTTITDPLTNQTILTYNPAGQPTAINAPLGVSTTLGYEAGDLVSINDALGNTTKRFVDGGGRLLAVTDPLGRLTRYTYDALNRLTQVTDAKGGVTSFTYDPNGNLLSVTDARNGLTSYTYNTMDRLATRTDPLLQPESYVYDNHGNLTQATDRKSQVSTFTYDALNRRTQGSFAGPSTTSYTYDAGNRLTQVTDSLAGTITRTYDGLDRLTQETTPQGTISYTFDAAGRRTGMTVAGQPAVAYTYDNGDRLTQVTQGSSTVAVAYDAANRRTSLTLPNGVVVEYVYDTASRLTGLTYKLGATTLGTSTYAYDATGSRTQVGGTWARTGLPDPITSATYNAANQQLALGPKTMSYDLNGNLMTITEGGATTTYTWDARNRLTGLSGPSLTASFGYDGLGRRWTKTINAARTDFLYDGLNPVQEGVLPSSPAANLLTGLGIDEFFTRTDVAGTRALLTDALGSTLALTDPTGAVTTEYTYEPFGDTTTIGASNSNTFQFTGRENDGTSLYYYRARYYHPGLQRFIAEDPIGFLGGDVNLYRYVRNSPLSFVDPVGLQLVRNFDYRPHLVKPGRGGDIGILPPGREWPQNIDGVLPPDGPPIKTPNPDYIPFTPIPSPTNIDVDILPGGKVVCLKGPCTIFPPYPDPTLKDRDDWKPPKNPQVLPGIRPIQPGAEPPGGRGDNYPPMTPW